MAAASSSSNHHVRSASYPPNANPVILKIEQQLKKLRESEASSTSPMQTISIGLTGLAGLYKCVDDALNYLPLLQHHHNNTQVERLVNGSLKLLDACIASREVVVRLKEAVGEVRLSNEKPREVCRYFSIRKEIVRNTKELALRLRQVEGELMAENRELSHEESELIRAFRCVSIIHISVMELLLQFLSSKLAKPSRFSLISKMFIARSKEAEELPGGKGNELRNADVALHAVILNEGDVGEKMVIVHKRLEGLEERLREIENGLSCISSQLAKTRASLLNIVSF